MSLTKEDYDSWRDNPVTQAVHEALRRKAEAAKAAWVDASWGSGEVSEVLLADLRATANICNDIRGLRFEELEEELRD
jgi:hypothetical protein